MGKPTAIVEKIQQLLPVHGCRPWWQKVTPEQAATLDEVLAAWKAGTFGPRKRTAARAISRALADLDISIGVQGVENWLRQS